MIQLPRLEWHKQCEWGLGEVKMAEVGPVYPPLEPSALSGSDPQNTAQVTLCKAPGLSLKKLAPVSCLLGHLLGVPSFHLASPVTMRPPRKRAHAAAWSTIPLAWPTSQSCQQGSHGSTAIRKAAETTQGLPSMPVDPESHPARSVLTHKVMRENKTALAF